MSGFDGGYTDNLDEVPILSDFDSAFDNNTGSHGGAILPSRDDGGKSSPPSVLRFSCKGKTIRLGTGGVGGNMEKGLPLKIQHENKKTLIAWKKVIVSEAYKDFPLPHDRVQDNLPDDVEPSIPGAKLDGKPEGRYTFTDLFKLVESKLAEKTRSRPSSSSSSPSSSSASSSSSSSSSASSSSSSYSSSSVSSSSSSSSSASSSSSSSSLNVNDQYRYDLLHATFGSLPEWNIPFVSVCALFQGDRADTNVQGGISLHEHVKKIVNAFSQCNDIKRLKDGNGKTRELAIRLIRQPDSDYVWTKHKLIRAIQAVMWVLDDEKGIIQACYHDDYEEMEKMEYYYEQWGRWDEDDFYQPEEEQKKKSKREKAEAQKRRRDREKAREEAEAKAQKRHDDRMDKIWELLSKLCEKLSAQVSPNEQTINDQPEILANGCAHMALQKGLYKIANVLTQIMGAKPFKLLKFNRYDDAGSERGAKWMLKSFVKEIEELQGKLTWTCMTNRFDISAVRVRVQQLRETGKWLLDYMEDSGDGDRMELSDEETCKYACIFGWGEKKVLDILNQQVININHRFGHVLACLLAAPVEAAPDSATQASIELAGAPSAPAEAASGKPAPKTAAGTAVNNSVFAKLKPWYDQARNLKATKGDSLPPEISAVVNVHVSPQNTVAFIWYNDDTSDSVARRYGNQLNLGEEAIGNFKKNLSGKVVLGKSMLFYACENGHLDLVKMIFKFAEQKEEKLHCGCCQIRTSGIRSSSRIEYLMTPLMAAICGNHAQVVDYLLNQNGANEFVSLDANEGVKVTENVAHDYDPDRDRPEFEQWYSQSPLYAAVCTKNPKIVESLLKINHILDIEEGYTCSDGCGDGCEETPLWVAVENEDLEIVKMLVEYGAYPQSGQSQFQHPNFVSSMRLAKQKQHLQIIMSLASSKVSNQRPSLHDKACATAHEEYTRTHYFRSSLGSRLERLIKDPHLSDTTKKIMEEKGLLEKRGVKRKRGDAVNGGGGSSSGGHGGRDGRSGDSASDKSQKRLGRQTMVAGGSAPEKARNAVKKRCSASKKTRKAVQKKGASKK
eukprot:g3999.t1